MLTKSMLQTQQLQNVDYSDTSIDDNRFLHKIAIVLMCGLWNFESIIAQKFDGEIGQ